VFKLDNKIYYTYFWYNNTRIFNLRINGVIKIVHIIEKKNIIATSYYRSLIILSTEENYKWSRNISCLLRNLITCRKDKILVQSKFKGIYGILKGIVKRIIIWSSEFDK
jgi:hypothetical protein